MHQRNLSTGITMVIPGLLVMPLLLGQGNASEIIEEAQDVDVVQVESEDCDPAYPDEDTCIPSPPPDLDCGDIDHKDFTVEEPDPHRFDRDNDGIGCES
jgi:micrococcal nuclease